MPKIFLIRQKLELQHQQLSGSIKNQDNQVFSWDILGERKPKSCDETEQHQPEDCSNKKYQQREDTEPALGKLTEASQPVSQSDSQQTCLVCSHQLRETTLGDNLMRNR